ncbi:MAG: hypothetical protein JXR96_17920 [Deltaproteobacteria bacterium]|nr:hypothetical protein [Deltaproteobacteria bacterium]
MSAIVRYWISGCLFAALSLLITDRAAAHFCNNIYDSPGRLVVKPERGTIDVPQGQTDSLRVFVRNNFPYVVSDMRMQATNTGDFSITVQPSVYSKVHPGEEVVFVFEITRDAGAGNDIRDLGLQIQVLGGNTEHSASNRDWRDYNHDGTSDSWLDDPAVPADDPAQNRLQSGMSSGQAQQMSAGTLARLYDEHSGVSRLLELYGRPRLMYNSNGGWGGGDWWAPYRDMEDNKYDYQLFRAGAELALRRYAGFNDPDLATVRQAMIDAMDDPDDDYRGIAALFGAYLGEDASVRARIELMASADTCVDQADKCTHYSWTTSASAQLMAKAALLVLGDGQYHAEVTTGLAHSNQMVRVICAAALGLTGEDDPVTDVLMPGCQDAWGYISLCGPVILQLVACDRRGPSGDGLVTFYGEVSDDTTPPRRPENLQVRPAD